MSNDILDTSDFIADTQQTEFADLDALFSRAREQQPSLIDDNFTKVVVNSLPVNIKRTQSHSAMFDFLGLFLGVIAAYLFFDLGQFTQSALSWVPESMSFTVANVTTLLCLGFGLSWLGWWTAEKAIN